MSHPILRPGTPDQDVSASGGGPGRSIESLVGNTPLLRLPPLDGVPAAVRILAKAEWFNPGGSVKDRAALGMILSAERQGLLTPGKIILDATSGNTGIAYALIGAARGYRVELAMPSNVSMERKRLLQAYGAAVHWTDPMEGSDGAIRRARALLREGRERYYMPDQYNNPHNPLAHYEGTGPEIMRQTAGEVTHFVAGIGTSGTLMGTGRYLREQRPEVQVIAVEPASPLHGLEGLKHMATSIVPGIYDPAFADRTLPIETEEAYARARWLARHGILTGMSGGAAWCGAVRIARELREGVVVCILPDGGDRYLSTVLFDDPRAPEGKS